MLRAAIALGGIFKEYPFAERLKKASSITQGIGLGGLWVFSTLGFCDSANEKDNRKLKQERIKGAAWMKQVAK